MSVSVSVSVSVVPCPVSHVSCAVSRVLYPVSPVPSRFMCEFSHAYFIRLILQQITFTMTFVAKRTTFSADQSNGSYFQKITCPAL
jgi:hypothetical protein